MPKSKSIVIDELHLTIRVPRGLPEAEYNGMKQVLDDDGFQTMLRRAVRAVMQQYPALRLVRVVLSR